MLASMATQWVIESDRHARAAMAVGSQTPWSTNAGT